MYFPKRGAYTYWHNVDPIDDAYEVLSLLALKTSSGHPTIIRESEEPLDIAEIERHWYREGSSGGDMAGIEYYQVTMGIFQRLQNFGMICYRRIPDGTGHYYNRYDQFVISTEGARNLGEYENHLRKIAQRMLKVGIHTDLTGEIRQLQTGREHWRHGALYVDFQCPNDRLCRIYPARREVIFPYTGAHTYTEMGSD